MFRGALCSHDHGAWRQREGHVTLSPDCLPPVPFCRCHTLGPSPHQIVSSVEWGRRLAHCASPLMGALTPAPEVGVVGTRASGHLALVGPLARAQGCSGCRPAVTARTAASSLPPSRWEEEATANQRLIPHGLRNL